MILRFFVAVITFWLAFDDGTYGLASRGSLAIAIWWALIVGIAFGLVVLAHQPRTVLIAGAFLGAFALLALVSTTWAASAEKAFTEFNRTALYLGVFALAALTSNRANLARWLEGMAIGVAAVGVLALASRLFPDHFPTGDIPRLLPSAATRLSYPVGYWNGLAILLALGFPLLLRIALTSNRVSLRALSLTALPVFSAVIYLASSRGGVAVAVAGTIAFIALTSDRWGALGAATVAAAGSAAATAILIPRNELVDGPLSSDAAVSQGRVAAGLIVLVCAATGLVYALAVRSWPTDLRPGPLVGRILTAAVIVVLLAGVAASNPVERFEDFKSVPSGAVGAERDFTKAHLLSGSGSGRWQMWETAADAFRDRPLVGQGAGAYEAWWAQHRDIAMFVRDAHSLYLEVLAELGILGLLLVVGALGTGVVALGRRISRFVADERTTVAAVGASFLAYLLALAIDWMWELTAVSVLGVALLGLLTGRATEASRPHDSRDPRAEPGSRLRARGRLAAAASVLVFAWLIICAQAIPLLAELQIENSQAAVRRGDGAAALDDAQAARNLQPWAASPYLQLALVREETEDLTGAREAIRTAIEKDSRDWRLWLVAARVETKLGSVSAARTDLARAAALNPKSPFFAGFAAG